MHLDIIRVFYYSPTDAQNSCFKRILKFTWKQFLHVSVHSPSLVSFFTSWEPVSFSRRALLHGVSVTHNDNNGSIFYESLLPLQRSCITLTVVACCTNCFVLSAVSITGLTVKGCKLYFYTHWMCLTVFHSTNYSKLLFQPDRST